MEWSDYKQRFEEEAQVQGLSDALVERHLAYARPLIIAGFPVIYNFAHLSSLLGYDKDALSQALLDPGSLYQSYAIPKKAGGWRRISEPKESLREIQKWILVMILNRCAPHEAATAFVRGRSIKQNAQPHVGQPMVLSLDVENFFPSLTATRVTNIFRELGYSESVAAFLTSMTTLNNGLPQGAPTSPLLSNLLLRSVDEELHDFAARAKITYSRYADDLTFSGRFHPGTVVRRVRSALAKCGLRLNDDKTRLMLAHERQEVTGIVVNQRLQAPRHVRRALRQELYYIQKYGLDQHERRTPSAYTNRTDHLRGIAEFIRFVNPDDRDALNAITALGRVHYGEKPPS